MCAFKSDYHRVCYVRNSVCVCVCVRVRACVRALVCVVVFVKAEQPKILLSESASLFSSFACSPLQISPSPDLLPGQGNKRPLLMRALLPGSIVPYGSGFSPLSVDAGLENTFEQPIKFTAFENKQNWP